jgi:sugar/nucleoside kinase (ribokinase family)
MNFAISLVKFLKMKKILGIGNALVDVMTLIDSESVLEKFLLPKGSMQLVDGEKSDKIKKGTINFPRSMASGGSAANTIHGLSMLGVPAGFIGSIGKDETGDFFENDFIKAGVKPLLFRRETPTGTAVALVTPDSERTFATYLGAAVELNASDLDQASFTGYDILYLEGYLIYNMPLVTEACKIAKRNKMKVALDLASYNVVETNLGNFKKIVEEYVDILFANEEESRAFTGLDPETALYRLSEMCETAVVKVGSEGSWMKRGEEVIKIGTISVSSVDTTGAGDLYASGFLYGMAKGESLEKCGLYGAVLAGKVIEIVGARLDENKWEEIKRMVSEISEDI